MEKTSLRFSNNIELNFSKGLFNILVEKIIKEFYPYYIPSAKLIYVGDAKRKKNFYNEVELEKLNIAVDPLHRKMPDIIFNYTKKGWLIIIETATNNRPITIKRKIELEELFSKSKVDLVFITAFDNIKTWQRYKGEVAWGTHIWIADNPAHLIHMNGKKFLGPYTKP